MAKIKSPCENVDIVRVDGEGRIYKVTAHYGRRQVSKRAEGLAAARALAKEMATAPAPAPTCVTLGQAVERYLASGVGRWSPKTLATKEVYLATHVVAVLGEGTDVRKIMPLDVQSVMDRARRRLASTTAAQVLAQCRALFAQLLAWGLIDTDPCRGIRGAKARPAARSVWEACHIEQALADPACPLAIRLLLVTGMRPEELQGLTWRCVDLDRGGVQVVQVAYYDKSRDRWAVRPGAKTATSERFIALDRATLDLLAEAKGRAGGYVITAARGGIIPLGSLRYMLRQYIEQAGLPMIALYTLRHSSITYLLSRGISPKVVAARVGHADVTTTLRHYAQVTDAAAQQAAALFSN